MTTAWPASTTLAINTGAINATGFTASDAIGANLNVSNTTAVAAAQTSHATTSLAASTKTASRTAQLYSLLTPSFAAQSDATQVLAFLLAGQAASAAESKYQAVGVITQITEIAIQALDEIFGYRAMPLHRPDNDQISTLIAQIAAARASAGLAALPLYSDARTSWTPL